MGRAGSCVHRCHQSRAGNLWFEWSRSVENPNQFVLLEAFRDGEAGAEHVGSEHFKAAIRELPALLAEIPHIVNVEVPGPEWAGPAEMKRSRIALRANCQQRRG